MTFKGIRIALLLTLLVIVAHHQFSERKRFASWDAPLFIAIYPINADQSSAAEQAIATAARTACRWWFSGPRALGGADTLVAFPLR